MFKYTADMKTGEVGIETYGTAPELAAEFMAFVKGMVDSKPENMKVVEGFVPAICNVMTKKRVLELVDKAYDAKERAEKIMGGDLKELGDLLKSLVENLSKAFSDEDEKPATPKKKAGRPRKTNKE